MGAWAESPRMRLDLNVWYPCARPQGNINISSWIVHASLNARCAEGKFPLLVISHPTSGSRFSYHELAGDLARAGFIVVAPTHSRDTFENMDDLFTWNQLARRVEEIDESIRLIHADATLGERLEDGDVGVIGFGAGASAALLLGGALPSCENWPTYRRRAPLDDPYVENWTAKKIDKICAELPLKKSLANRDVRAVAVIAPAFGMLFDEASFRYFYPPALLVSAGKDKFNLAELHTYPVARALGKKASFLDLPLADTGAIMSDCPPQLRMEMADLCLSQSQEIKRSARSALRDELVAFFQYYLRDPAKLPNIPEPPDLTPPPPPRSPIEKPRSSRRK